MSLANKLTEERRRRLAAERLLELKQAELHAAHRKLGLHARKLTNEIVETRANIETMRHENARVKSDLSAAHEKIALTERRLWQSIMSIRDGFVLFNADNEMIFANASYMSVFEGLEIIRPGISYVTILQIMTDEGIVDLQGACPDEWRERMIARWQQDRPKPTVMRLWNGASIKVIDQRGPGGDLVSLCLDITESVRHEAALRAAREEAEAAARAKSAFLANMSHEIRTPMNGVVGMADVLGETNLTEEQRLYVETIRNSGEALLVIINDVLDYSKIEADKLDLHPEPFDLERTIQEVMMLLQPLADDKGLTLTLDYDLFMPTEVIGDAGRIRQVLTNLMGNAVKFTQEGHVLIRVTGMTDTEKGVSDIRIAIEDTGIGIPADKIDHIFGEFQQVENERNRKFDGTGLGLAISKRLITLMSGDIWVESEEGKGCCFAFMLPLELANPDLPELPLLPNDMRRVMIVSDIGINAKTLDRQLRQLGVETTLFNNAPDALAALNGEHQVDLVLTEHNQTHMSGFELAEAAHTAGCNVPFVVMTANPTTAAQDPARDHVAGLVTRPFSRAALFKELIAVSKGQSAPELQTPAAPRQMRILAAEDNKTNQLVFRKMIKVLNVDLVFADNGEQAVALYRSFVPDMIFMDISMPVMDGKEATQKIRALEPEGTHTPIIALTAHAMEGDDQSILDAGLDHYLTKPLRKPAIFEQIKNAQPDGTLPLNDQDAP